MRLNKFVPLLLALAIHVLPLSYLLFKKDPIVGPKESQTSGLGPQGIDLAGFSTKKKKNSTAASTSPSKSVSSSISTAPSFSAGATNANSSSAPTADMASTGNQGSASGSAGSNESLILSSVEPLYPPLARQKGFEGSVKLRAHYDTRGVITKIEIINSSGTKMLDESARKALMAWKLKAGSEGSFEKTFQFKLNN